MSNRFISPSKPVILASCTLAVMCLAAPASQAQDVVHVIPQGVGVYTDNPIAPLHVKDPSPTTEGLAALVELGDMQLKKPGANPMSFRFTNGVRSWYFRNGNTGFFRIQDVTGGTVPVQIAPGAHSNLLVLRDGNIGIKNFTPSYPIHHASGARLTGGGVWTNASSRTLKTAFEAIDPLAVLAKVAALPVQAWRYKVEDSDTRHIGPVAEDFQRLFGLGDGESIGTVDANGVALAAIQGLSRKLEEKDKQIAELQARLEALERAQTP